MRDQPTPIAPPGATSNAGPILVELAERAERHHTNSGRSWLRCAAVLFEARAIAGHGGWTSFLRDAGIRPRTASRMLDFARAGIQIGHLAVLTRGEVAALISQAGRDFPDRAPDSAYAKALVTAVIEIAGERGYDPGELADFISEFPARPVPRTQ